jgi:hypothetical protein
MLWQVLVLASGVPLFCPLLALAVFPQLLASGFFLEHLKQGHPTIHLIIGRETLSED